MTPTIIKTRNGLIVTGLSPLQTKYVVSAACAAVQDAIPAARESATAAILDQMIRGVDCGTEPVGLLA